MIDNERINKVSAQIAKFVYDIMKRRITRGLRELSSDNKNKIGLHVASAVMVQSLGNLDAAFLRTVKELFEKCDGKSESFTELLTIYFEYLLNHLGKDGDEVRENLIKNIKH